MSSARTIRRVAVLGPVAAGKTTFALELGRGLGLPVHHLDQFRWRAGWVPVPDDEWEQIELRFASGDSWVIDGTMEERMPYLEAADTLVFLDYSPVVCAWRAIRRTAKVRGGARPDLPPGCPEGINWRVFGWISRYRREHRPKVLARLEALGSERRVFVARQPREARRLLAELTAEGMSAEADGAPET
jgi:adenylate kinase family enzyme